MELYTPVHERLTRYCHAITKDDDDTRDLVNDTVLAVLDNFEKIRNKDAFLYYMFGTASRIFKSNQRRKKRNPTAENKDLLRLEENGVSPEVSLDVELLYKALDKLNEKQKQAIILFEISGFSLKEICEIQKSNLSAVKVRLMRGRKKLQHLLSE